MQIVCQTHGMGEGEVIYSKCVELVEQKINSLQQLKAEISLGVGSIARDSSIPAVDRLDKIVVFVNEKLSAV
jgi:hypothetical protein